MNLTSMDISIMNFIVNITKFTLTITIMYISLIFLICRIRKTDVKTSIQIFWDYFLSCFGFPPNNSPNMNSYPVYIGIDEFGNPNADVIEDTFKNLESDFESFYFYNYIQYPNRLFYYFKAELPRKEMSTFNLVRYMRKKSDQIVHRHMHRINPQISHIESLVAVDYCDNILTVSIAKNMAGVTENNDIIQRLYRQYRESANHRNNIIKEGWDDDGFKS